MHARHSLRALAAPIPALLVVALLGATVACDPERVHEIFEGGGGHPPSGGGTVDGGAPGTPVVHCGGIAGRPCPGAGKCVDDPSDKCDPATGGADCGGICQCIQTVACVMGAKFDNSPSVCACVVPTVPPPPVCGPVCQIFCEFGNVLDAKGCPTCACNPPPKPTDPCAAVLCVAGTHCEANAVMCVKAPCPPVVRCVPDVPAKVECGGFAGKRCPGAGKCADDPSDDCDPAKGDVDCIGICQCIQTVACVVGAKFDNSPSVCACVTPTPPPTCGPVCQIFCENGNFLDANGCPTCACNPPPKPTDPCATIKCAAGTHCVADAVMCVKAPCPAIAACVPDAPPPPPVSVFCGGIAGIACPGGGQCADDPTDMCDPKAGGADCGGICQCIQKVACVKGATFDSSPKVCACVPAMNPVPPECGPVCDIFCAYGHVLDAKGCPTCACNPPPKPGLPCSACAQPRPGVPNVMCSDGKTVGGPSCLTTDTGTCGWTIVACP